MRKYVRDVTMAEVGTRWDGKHWHDAITLHTAAGNAVIVELTPGQMADLAGRLQLHVGQAQARAAKGEQQK